ncbi:phytoene desaturase family protein [Fodinibius sediminis]|uniref:Phytoene dehydrogenase-related protein n=1 Tax=Fodinibius sediminis TaxID=1214077 RepID=A0A521E3L1_9BACT|nr:NAD(P)/FAD-dependent oxidoreductase [Fodinibius sediminis]SMO78533.1 Phytoene dehydrogenase-related protein [Fodinibius sediminis]
MPDAIIIGSGPNGLAAGIRLAEEGLSVKIFEKEPTIGGGTRTLELTAPGFRHDICSAIHPMAKASPFLSRLPLEEYGLEWIHPEVPVAHPLDDQPAGALFRSLDRTVDRFGKDGHTYRRWVSPFIDSWDELLKDILAPFSPIPYNPVLMARFGLKALRSAGGFAKRYQTEKARAVFAGIAAHGIMPFDAPATAAIGLVLGIAAHTVGWPYPKGGSHAITQAMGTYFKSLGGTIETGVTITSVDDFGHAGVILFNTTPRQILDITGNKLPLSYIQKLRKYQYGQGVFKLDFALSDPIPWSDKLCRKAGTVHVGGTLEEIARSEKQSASGQLPEKPYVLVAQQSLGDKSRAPSGNHTGWAYCHVPNGAAEDMTEPIITQIERFAPGFRDCIINMHRTNAQEMQAYNPNYIGGDINGGRADISQLFTRPAGLFDPYHIPKSNMYIASSSTPPGGGVHGMCGYHAAESVLRRDF